MDITQDFRDLLTRHYDSEFREKQNPHCRRDPKQSNDDWIKEAYRLSSSIQALRLFLISIRKAYLGQTAVTKIDTSKLHGMPDLAAWCNVKTMTDRDRDTVDFEAKVIIKQCLEQVKQLSKVEKLRQIQITRSNPISSFFKSSKAIEESELLAAHRASVMWSLNQLLSSASSLQKDQQERRLIRQLEKSQSMLDRATGQKNSISQRQNEAAKARKQRLEQEISLELQSNRNSSRYMNDGTSENLPSELVQTLELENKNLLKEMESTMNQVKKAEKALLEISELQAELSSHLAIQTHKTDKLFAEAVDASDQVGEGNLYLIKAKESNSATRKYILVFLLVSSFLLLFLDRYN